MLLLPQYQGTLSTEQSEESWYTGESREKRRKFKAMFSSKLVNLAEILIMFEIMYGHVLSARTDHLQVSTNHEGIVDALPRFLGVCSWEF